MIATWLVEIYLSKINTLEDLAASSAGSDDIGNFKAEQKDLEDEFKGFLEQYKVFDRVYYSQGILDVCSRICIVTLFFFSE
jgi:hypothetical protein